MSVVPLQCPVCTGLIQIDVALGGQQVACPLCQSVMSLPPVEVLLGILAQTGGQPVPPPSQGPPPGEVIQLACPVCAGPFQVLTSMAGQQVGCPHCASPVLIPPLGPVMTPQVSAPQFSEPPAFEPPPSDDVSSMLPPGATSGPPPAAPRTQAPPQQPAESDADRLPPGARPKPRPSAPPTRKAPRGRPPRRPRGQRATAFRPA